MQGWIKLHRQFLEWEWYSDTNTARVFIHCLLKANHKDVKWRGKEIKRGSFLTGLNKLSIELNLSNQQVRTALNKLEKTQEINRQSTNEGTYLTVCKYDTYQDDEETNQQASNKRITNEQQTNNKRITTNKNDKKEKNEENEKKRVSKSPSLPKIKLGEFDNIEIESDKIGELQNRYEKIKLDWMIEKLGAWMVNKKKSCKTYKSLIAYFSNWVEKAYDEQMKNKKIPIGGSLFYEEVPM